MGRPSGVAQAASRRAAWVPASTPAIKAGEGGVGASESVGGESGPPLLRTNPVRPKDKLRFFLPDAKAVVVVIEIGQEPLRELLLPLETRRPYPCRERLRSLDRERPASGRLRSIMERNASRKCIKLAQFRRQHRRRSSLVRMDEVLFILPEGKSGVVVGKLSKPSVPLAMRLLYRCRRRCRGDFGPLQPPQGSLQGP
eukprot:1297500-Amphidinium_carterae.1